jgi:hypothetical protein
VPLAVLLKGLNSGGKPLIGSVLVQCNCKWMHWIRIMQMMTAAGA